jgi:hypothetical protein
VIVAGGHRDAFTAGMMGLATERATANLPQTTTLPIFRILGGRVSAFLILGEVTTVIQAQANNTKLTAVPTVGSAVDICAVVDINALEVGGKLFAANVAAAALQKTNTGAAFGAYGFTTLAVGTLNLNCAASSTGQVKWTLFWVPMDSGAAVEAA